MCRLWAECAKQLNVVSEQCVVSGQCVMSGQRKFVKLATKARGYSINRNSTSRFPRVALSIQIPNIYQLNGIPHTCTGISKIKIRI